MTATCSRVNTLTGFGYSSCHQNIISDKTPLVSKDASLYAIDGGSLGTIYVMGGLRLFFGHDSISFIISSSYFIDLLIWILCKQL